MQGYSGGPSPVRLQGGAPKKKAKLDTSSSHRPTDSDDPSYGEYRSVQRKGHCRRSKRAKCPSLVPSEVEEEIEIDDAEEQQQGDDNDDDNGAGVGAGGNGGGGGDDDPDDDDGDDNEDDDEGDGDEEDEGETVYPIDLKLLCCFNLFDFEI